MSISSEKKTNLPALSISGGQPGHKDISIPLYIGGAVAQLAGLTAVAYQLTEPSFAYFTMLLTLVGLTCSYFLRRYGSSPRLIQVGAALVALMFIAALRGVGPFQNLVPFEAQGSQELLLVCALAFTATFCSFLLVTDESVMFTCVWAIAIIGLTGTVNINQELIICFVVFLAASTFLLVHQNSLSGGMPTVTEAALLGEEESPALPSIPGHVRATTTIRARWRLLRTQVNVALACAAGAAMLGFLIAIPLQMIGRNLSLANVIQRLNVPPAAAQQLTGGRLGTIQLEFNNSQDFQVGLGPVGDDQTERARVESPRPLYWRGRLFDFYTGRGWANSFIGQNVYGEPVEPKGEVDAEGFSTFPIKPVEYERKKVERVKYRFHMNNNRFTPLYVAAEARQVRLPSVQITLRPDHTMSASNSYGPEYEAISDVPTNVRPSDLRKTTQSESGYSPEMRQLYLQGRTNDALDALAEQIVTDANATNPYDKAEALRQWVSTNCVYTLDAPAVPRGRDAAEYFLRESKQGYCDLYATAFTILCRHAGLPARVATGFAPGIEDPQAKTKTFVLREADRHAWTEIYFQGYGWIVFDATQDTPGTTPAARTPEPQTDQRFLWERILAAGWLPVTMTLIGFCGFLYFLFMEILLAIRNRVHQVIPTHAVAVNARHVVRQYQNVTKKLARRGLRRTPQMTTTEYLHQVRERFGQPVYDAFAPLTALFQRAVYGTENGSQIGAADTESANKAVKQLETALKETKRASR
ncbi:MAG: DUF4129 domain-containing protein [Fibrella sp.]|nr:DUF4129 domain-containing protein [Armatimonadota bacterium]